MAAKKDEPGTAVVPAKAPLIGGAKLMAIVPTDVEQAWRIANIIAAADMAPKSYGKDPNKVMVGILHGMEVGLTPMAALQSIAVINGTPSVWGDGALALVQGSGLLVDITEALQGDGDNMVAICTVQRVGRETATTRRFSVADAKKAQLWTKQGPWTQYPQRMLQMRARSWAIRDAFPDVLKGLGVAEEMQDVQRLHIGPDGAYVVPEPPTRESVKASGGGPVRDTVGVGGTQGGVTVVEEEQQSDQSGGLYEFYGADGALATSFDDGLEYVIHLGTIIIRYPANKAALLKANEATIAIVLEEMKDLDHPAVNDLRKWMAPPEPEAQQGPENQAEPAQAEVKAIAMPTNDKGVPIVSKYVKTIGDELATAPDEAMVRRIMAREKTNLALIGGAKSAVELHARKRLAALGVDANGSLE